MKAGTRRQRDTADEIHDAYDARKVHAYGGGASVADGYPVDGPSSSLGDHLIAAALDGMTKRLVGRANHMAGVGFMAFALGGADADGDG